MIVSRLALFLGWRKSNRFVRNLKGRNMKRFFVLFTTLLLISVNFLVEAAGWANPAVPSHIEIERGGGFMVHGAFGNAGECTIANKFYVNSDHPQYDKVYSMILTAYIAKKKIKPYINSCGAVTWHSISSVTYNIMSKSGAIYIHD